MLSYFRHSNGTLYAVQHTQSFTDDDQKALFWLFDGATPADDATLRRPYIGPRAEMITPWSTTAVEITQTMGIVGIERIEPFVPADDSTTYDKMLLRRYPDLEGNIFGEAMAPAAIIEIKDLQQYNIEQGLALSSEEISYLTQLAAQLGRPLTDSEVFGFSQVNSEHCRHKIFGGTFVIDGEEQDRSLFAMIKETSAISPNRLVSAYKDNVAFNQGPVIEQFAPTQGDTSSFFATKDIESVLSLKAETHNFPTTVEPFNGAATGSGGEIRDRMAGGKASLPLAGTAVYMTSYTRDNAEKRPWECSIDARAWLYQTPQEILTKASNGASDFGNKFGQPLICGSLLTFEHQEREHTWGYDKVIMLAGGIGFANKRDALKGAPQPGEKVVVMGGDNYRIGMGGGAVSSVNTGEMRDAIELNAIQRSNPEMQKRVANVVRSLAESDSNPIVSIHDHGAGGHLNCLSELIEATGGHIDMSALPIGDPTLSAKEIIGNESQERMGLLVGQEHIERIERIAARERAPFYVVGETTNDMALVFEQADGVKPIDLRLEHMFGSAPKTIMTDKSVEQTFAEPATLSAPLQEYVEGVLRLESVASKDWLTNKVDRSVTGKVARQQCQGELQLPLSDLGAMALDYRGKSGIATSIGHAPSVALVNPAAGSRLAIAEALTNLLGAPMDSIEAISLSANWMWPCRNEGEDARLYAAVEACSDFAIDLGINIPTGKDSLSMTQRYPDGKRVLAPGTLIVSAAAETSDVRRIISPVIKRNESRSALVHVDFSFAPAALGGSALYQTLGYVGQTIPDVLDTEYFTDAYKAVMELVRSKESHVLAIHDISEGGLITTLLEMTFANTSGGLQLDLSMLSQHEATTMLFAENPGVILQVRDPKAVIKALESKGIASMQIATLTDERTLTVRTKNGSTKLDINQLRSVWYEASARMERYQTSEVCAAERSKNIFEQPVAYRFGNDFKGTLAGYGKSYDRSKSGIVAAIVRDKGTNGEREMAYALYLAGFDVKDVHITDLMTGRETLEEVQMLVFCGGFSNSDVLGSAKGWAAGFLYNERAKAALDAFYARPDTLSLGICNGCQLLAELELLYPDHEQKHKMRHNASGRFESGFVSLEIPQNNTVMLGSLSGQRIGVWIAHGEGRFELPYGVDQYNVTAQYAYDAYPANPNDSPHAIAALASRCGRHIAMMPHPERCIFPWQCGYYPDREGMEVTPWFEAFVNAFDWCREHHR